MFARTVYRLHARIHRSRLFLHGRYYWRGLYELAENRTQTPDVIAPVLLSVLFYPSVEFNANIFSPPRNNPPPNRKHGVRRRALFLNYWSERVVLARGNKDEVAEPPGRKFLRPRGLARRVPAAEIFGRWRPDDVSQRRVVLKLREMGQLLQQKDSYYYCLRNENTYR